MKTLKEEIQKTTQILDVTDSTYNISVRAWKKSNIVTVFITSAGLATSISKGSITSTLASLPARIQTAFSIN